MSQAQYIKQNQFSSIHTRPSSYVPYILETTAKGDRGYDIYSRLLKDRIIFLGTPIYDEEAAAVIAQMLYLQLESKDDDIHLYIMSPGGSVSAGLAIYDTMQSLSNDVSTHCIGEACSMGAVLLAAGTKGKRYALPHSKIMIHQPSGGAWGTESDITITAKEITNIKATLNKILATHTGRTVAQIEKDCDRDCYMTAEQSVKYGIVDKIVSKKPKAK